MKKSDEFYEIRASGGASGDGYYRWLDNAKSALEKKATEISHRTNVFHPGDGMSFEFDTGGWDSVHVMWFIKIHKFEDVT